LLGSTTATVVGMSLILAPTTVVASILFVAWRR
jgi:hypothetical protein